MHKIKQIISGLRGAFFPLIPLFFLFSCYQSLDRGLFSHKVDVPLIVGDYSGGLQAAIIEEMGMQGPFFYGRGGEFQLLVNLQTVEKEQIGYKYDQEPLTGKRINRLVPNEGRREVVAKVQLCNKKTDEVIWGPLYFTGKSDYDFVNPNSLESVMFDPIDQSETTVLAYSLGQLDSEEGAAATALQIAYQNLAKQITAYLFSSSQRNF